MEEDREREVDSKMEEEGEGWKSHWKILTIFHSVQTMTAGQFPSDALDDKQVNQGAGEL